MKALLVEDSMESDELSKNIYTILNDCYKSFKESFFDKDEVISCKLFSILDGTEKEHVAPACNIASTIKEIECFLHSIGINGKNEVNKNLSFVHVKIFITLLFYIYQELDVYHEYIFKSKDVVSLDYYNGNFLQVYDKSNKEKNRNVCLLKSYANFFKHPKLVTHIHHSMIYIEHLTGNAIDMDFICEDYFIKMFDRQVSNEILERFLNKKGVVLVFNDLTLLVSGVAKIAKDLIDFSLNNEDVKNIILNDLSCKLD